jgi:hypothetical protein
MSMFAFVLLHPNQSSEEAFQFKGTKLWNGRVNGDSSKYLKLLQLKPLFTEQRFSLFLSTIFFIYESL